MRPGFVGVNQVSIFQVKLEELLRACRNGVDHCGSGNMRVALPKVANIIAKRCDR